MQDTHAKINMQDKHAKISIVVGFPSSFDNKIEFFIPYQEAHTNELEMQMKIKLENHLGLGIFVLLRAGQATIGIEGTDTVERLEFWHTGILAHLGQLTKSLTWQLS